jgi:uncharacterized protein (UPF0276 family)
VIKIATPISHLFSDLAARDQIIAASDCLECRDRTIDDQSKNQELFHCELQPIHKFTDIEFSYLNDISKKKLDLKLVTFHMASCCDSPIMDRTLFKGGVYQLGGRKYSREEMLVNAKQNFYEIKAIFGKDVKIAVENNNYYPTEAYKYVTDSDFINDIVCQNDVDFLFDIAHAQVTAHNRRIHFDEYKNGLPLAKAIQLHICSPAIDVSSNMAYDAHDYPSHSKLLQVHRLLKENSSIKYLTVEYYRDVDNLIKSIDSISKLTIN